MSPDPVEAALACERAGADSIVCHLREDRRHIQDGDLEGLKQAISTRLNLEMSIAKDIVAVALALHPHQVTLVPERRQELTTEGGLDLYRLSRRLHPVVRAFRARGIPVSLFIDPFANQLTAARDLGVTIVELHTGRCANARTALAKTRALAALRLAAQRGRSLGLTIAAGHGLDYENVQDIADIPELEEVNIGFSIISRALRVGLEQAVGDMIERLQGKRSHAVQANA
jgi:pyridoxine 5-phosphate synthase